LGVFEFERKLFDVASQKYMVCARTRRGSKTRARVQGDCLKEEEEEIFGGWRVFF